MGGLMILIGIIASTLMWADLQNIYIWIVLFVCTGLGLLGFVDDYLKVIMKNISTPSFPFSFNAYGGVSGSLRTCMARLFVLEQDYKQKMKNEVI